MYVCADVKYVCSVSIAAHFSIFFRLLTKEVLAVRVVDYGIKMKQFDGDNERDIQRG